MLTVSPAWSRLVYAGIVVTAALACRLIGDGYQL